MGVHQVPNNKGYSNYHLLPNIDINETFGLKLLDIRREIWKRSLISMARGESWLACSFSPPTSAEGFGIKHGKNV